MENAVACIGAAHIDRKAVAVGPVTLGSSNPVTIFEKPGGVARNVAENLTRLGLSVALISRVGTDMDGNTVLNDLVATGIDTRLVSRSTTQRTASYTALLDGRGELVIGLADMDIYDELTVPVLEALLPELTGMPVWFVDSNLSAESLHFLVRNKPAGCSIYIDAVSVAKAPRLTGGLRGIDTLFINQDEAEILAQVQIRAPLDVCEAGYRLLSRGVTSVIISRGSAGAFMAAPYKYEFFAAATAAVREVTGAGDALIAGTLFGRLTGRPLDEALRIGLSCAAWAVEVDETVRPDLTAGLALERAGLLRESA